MLRCPEIQAGIYFVVHLAQLKLIEKQLYRSGLVSADTVTNLEAFDDKHSSA